MQDLMGRTCYEGVASTEKRSASPYQYTGMPSNPRRLDLGVDQGACEYKRRCEYEGVERWRKGTDEAVDG